MRGDRWLEESNDPVLRGLALNPSTPDDVLLRLVQAHGERATDGLRRRSNLPAAVVEAMLRHPVPQVRAAVATSQAVDPDTRLRLLDDPSRAVVERLCDDRSLELPEHALRWPLDRLNSYVERDVITLDEFRQEVWEALTKDQRLMVPASRHPKARVRAAACMVLSKYDEPTRQALLHDDAPEVRAAAAKQLDHDTRRRVPADLPPLGEWERSQVLSKPLSRELVDEVIASGDESDLAKLACNPTTPPDVVDALLAHPSHEVRGAVTCRRDLTSSQLARLAADPDASIRTAISTHAGVTETQQASIDIDVTTEPFPGHDPFCRYLPDWPLPTLEESIRRARSINPLVRRRAARDHRLPADLVTALTNDSDFGVWVLLALYHPAAPPALLLRAYLEYCVCGRDTLLGKPNFPTDQLARFADDPDPAARRLVALDPAADPAIVDRLTTDPDEKVRTAMAGCPRLPVARIVELLDHPELAGAAAANPALPLATMEHLLVTARQSAE